ncbi:uncharacterized protein LOC122034587 [Zingiber officinale]|uniref:uncharacterized protein LOC122034587 n=2 Tax=Zingiber officinale TaxID=94328 RepID=UPI001C4BE316|nr:uncharacterized protein LOC122034587 [Zingiber officinale]
MLKFFSRTLNFSHPNLSSTLTLASALLVGRNRSSKQGAFRRPARAFSKDFFTVVSLASRRSREHEEGAKIVEIWSSPETLEPSSSAVSPRNRMASDRFNINSQLEHLQAKYVGTGHADLNRFEWGVNIQRDSYASYIGHYPILAYFSVAENESIGRQRYNFMQKMLLPCGLPPEREED